MNGAGPGKISVAQTAWNSSRHWRVCIPRPHGISCLFDISSCPGLLTRGISDACKLPPALREYNGQSGWIRHYTKWVFTAVYIHTPLGANTPTAGMFIDVIVLVLFIVGIEVSCKVKTTQYHHHRFLHPYDNRGMK